MRWNAITIEIGNFIVYIQRGGKTLSRPLFLASKHHSNTNFQPSGFRCSGVGSRPEIGVKGDIIGRGIPLVGKINNKTADQN